MLPILGALPDALIILQSGTGGSGEGAKEQVAVGIGALAGERWEQGTNFPMNRDLLPLLT